MLSSFYRQIAHGRELLLHVRVMSVTAQAPSTTTGHGANVEMASSVLPVTKFTAANKQIPMLSCTGRELPRSAVANVATVAQATIAY
jgi:hypothetical protein